MSILNGFKYDNESSEKIVVVSQSVTIIKDNEGSEFIITSGNYLIKYLDEHLGIKTHS